MSDNQPPPRGLEWTIKRPWVTQDFEMKTAAGHTQLKYIKGDLLCPFIFLLSFSVVLTVKKRKFETTESPLYHRKHGSRNASSVVPPLTSYYITMSHICICYAYMFMVEVKLTGCWKQGEPTRRRGERCWLRRVWAGQSEQNGYSGGRALKRQELKRSIYEKRVFFSTKAWKHILVVVMNMKMNIVRLL